MHGRGHNVQVHMHASAQDLKQAILDSEECNCDHPIPRVGTQCFGVEVTSTSNLDYTLYTQEGALPKLSAMPDDLVTDYGRHVNTMSACRPYWASLHPPEKYPDADKPPTTNPPTPNTEGLHAKAAAQAKPGSDPSKTRQRFRASLAEPLANGVVDLTALEIHGSTPPRWRRCRR